MRRLLWLLMIIAVSGSPVLAQAPPDPPGTTDECADALEKIDQYSAILAASFLSLNQLEGKLSDLNEQLEAEIEILRLEQELLRRMELRGASVQERQAQLTAINLAKAAIDKTKAEIAVVGAQIEGTKALIDRTAAARVALQAWYDANCGEGTEGTGPVPDPNF